jgi:hypothetical protein
VRLGSHESSGPGRAVPANVWGMVFVSNLVNVHEHSNLVVADDWAPAFAAAIAEAVTTRREGVLVPAYGTDYTVRKPARGVPSIDLRGRSNFVLVGEGDGSRIRMLGSGLGGSWNMIMIGGDCVDVTVRNLYLDGDRSNLTELKQRLSRCHPPIILRDHAAVRGFTGAAAVPGRRGTGGRCLY